MTPQGSALIRGRLARPALLTLVFVAGMSGMAVEMAGSRLLAPYFGNSLIVWANLIGLIMVYLTVGYYVGGWLGDRYPFPAGVYRITLAASVAIALVPLAARPILQYAARGFADYQWGLVGGSFIGVVALFALPMVLLGCVSPYAIRLSIQGLHATGRVSGRIYALSTLGSILGTFLPVFLFVPAIGTRSTFLLFALALSLASALGLWQSIGRRAISFLLLPLLIAGIWILTRPGLIKPTAGLVYEAESEYNYIQVMKQDDAYILKLNEGEGNQSVYVPGQVLLHRIFDYFLAAPLFRPHDASALPEHVCVIGLAGGTMAKQYSDVYGPVPIDGVEIDPKLIRVAETFFGLTMPNVHTYAEDGRYFLQQTSNTYDVIILDAYKPPYIPFQLTTVEFFSEALSRLSDHGVVAVNVARTDTDYALVNAIASTMLAVFPKVYIVDATESYNSMIVGTRDDVSKDDVAYHVSQVSDPVLQDVASRTWAHLRAFDAAVTEPLRDDRAPVERIVHNMIWRFAWGG